MFFLFVLFLLNHVSSVKSLSVFFKKYLLCVTSNLFQNLCYINSFINVLRQRDPTILFLYFVVITVQEELNCLSEQLRDDVSKLDTEAQCAPVVGGVYTSKFEGLWYRCVVEQVSCFPSVCIG